MKYKYIQFVTILFMMTLSACSSKENREELSRSIDKFENKFGKNIKDVKETINTQLKDIIHALQDELENLNTTKNEDINKVRNTHAYHKQDSRKAVDDFSSIVSDENSNQYIDQSTNYKRRGS